jgi:hypothetical protein
LTLLTLIVLMVSVPRKYGKRGLYAFAILLLFTAYSTMRHFADGNLEGLIIGGVLLLLYAYQQENLWLLCVGLLCVTAKPQETFLLVVVLGLWLWQRWQWRHWLAVGLLTLFVMGATLVWQGQAFLDSLARMPDRGQLMDISLTSSVARFGLPGWVTLVAGLAIAAVSIFLTFRAQPRFDRERAALLLAASMLASPYTAGNSYLTIIAIGVIPLFLKRPA